MSRGEEKSITEKFQFYSEQKQLCRNADAINISIFHGIIFFSSRYLNPSCNDSSTPTRPIVFFSLSGPGPGSSMPSYRMSTKESRPFFSGGALHFRCRPFWVLVRETSVLPMRIYRSTCTIFGLVSAATRRVSQELLLPLAVVLACISCSRHAMQWKSNYRRVGSSSATGNLNTQSAS